MTAPGHHHKGEPPPLDVLAQNAQDFELRSRRRTTLVFSAVTAMVILALATWSAALYESARMADIEARRARLVADQAKRFQQTTVQLQKRLEDAELKLRSSVAARSSDEKFYVSGAGELFARGSS